MGKARVLVSFGNNLYRSVGEKSANWVMRIKVNKRSYMLGLGSCELVTEMAAKIKAKKMKRLILAGVDPYKARNFDESEFSLCGLCYQKISKLEINRNSKWKMKFKDNKELIELSQIVYQGKRRISHEEKHNV